MKKRRVLYSTAFSHHAAYSIFQLWKNTAFWFYFYISRGYGKSAIVHLAWGNVQRELAEAILRLYLFAGRGGGFFL